MAVVCLVARSGKLTSGFVVQEPAVPAAETTETPAAEPAAEEAKPVSTVAVHRRRSCR